MKTVRAIAYIIIFYVAAFVIWWMVLLTRVEKQKFELQQQNLELTNNGVLPDKFSEMQKEYTNNKKQIFYEGIVFLLLLAVSSYYVIRGINREKKFTELKRNFLLATTHELKTPLSATKLNLQTLLRKQIEPNTKERLINNSLTEIDRLNQLVNNILLASKIDAIDYTFGKEKISFSEILQKIIYQHPQKQRLVSQIASGLVVEADQSAVEVVVQNLIDNALKYSPEDTQVYIELKSKKSMIELQVKDQGIGVPATEHKKIFKRFYRIEDEQIRQTKGTGLGLFLAWEMVQLMNGTITVSDNQPKGSIFTVEIPHTR